MSQFNPDSFLSTETTEANESKYTPIPEGEYQAIIEDVKARTTKNGTPILDVVYDITDEDLKQQLGMETIRVRQSVFLDMTDNGTLATGPNQNVALGRLREAVGQNQSGQPWAPLMLKGAGPLLIYVTQRPDENDPEVIYNDVKRTSKLA